MGRPVSRPNVSGKKLRSVPHHVEICISLPRGFQVRSDACGYLIIPGTGGGKANDAEIAPTSIRSGREPHGAGREHTAARVRYGGVEAAVVINRGFVHGNGLPVVDGHG